MTPVARSDDEGLALRSLVQMLPVLSAILIVMMGCGGDTDIAEDAGSNAQDGSGRTTGSDSSTPSTDSSTGTGDDSAVGGAGGAGTMDSSTGVTGGTGDTGGTSSSVDCKTSTDCPGMMLCRSERCVEPTVLPADQCPKIEAGDQIPTTIESSFEQIEETGLSIARVWFEENSTYWFDTGGALHVLRRDSSDSHQILRLSVDEIYVKAMYTDNNNLYWSEGRAIPWRPVEPGEQWLPPGLLYSVPKQGGEVELLHQDNSLIYDPVGTLDERLVLQRDDGVLFTIAKDGTGLEQLGWDEYVLDLSVIDNQVYWLQSSSTGEIGEYFELWRSDFEGVSPMLVTLIEGTRFLSRDGKILWSRVGQYYVMLDEATGCTSTLPELPGLGETISYDSVMDDRHVYWHSFNRLGSLSPGDPLPETPLVRVDLNTGALEQIVTPGFTAVVGDDIVGQTVDTLYIITNNRQLIAIEKPH